MVQSCERRKAFAEVGTKSFLYSLILTSSGHEEVRISAKGSEDTIWSKVAAWVVARRPQSLSLSIDVGRG